MTAHTPRFYITGTHRCGYLPGRAAQNLLLDPSWPISPAGYGELLAQGFRRSGDHVYRPHCAGCQACQPVRVAVEQHRPNRNQRRALRRNADLHLSIEPARYSDEHFALFARYLRGRHGDSDMANTTPEQYTEFLLSRWCRSEFLCLRGRGGELLAVAVTDRSEDALSAIYTYFDPALRTRSLGRTCVLLQIARCRELGLPWLYLGYWIAQCRNMAYKVEYQPLERLSRQRWSRLPAS